jgi:hypothetical protein
MFARVTGNLKIMKKVPRFAAIKTTMRYAYLLDEEIAAAMEAQ